MCALADAYKLFRDFDLPAPGRVRRDRERRPPARLQRRQGRGLLRWAIPILKVVFDGVSDSVDYEAHEMADEYYRFQEDSVAETPTEGGRRTAARTYGTLGLVDRTVTAPPPLATFLTLAP